METKLDPDQKIPGLEKVTVGDFWMWAYSDILTNTNRAIFAEFIVGVALEAVNSPRMEWDNVDLRYREKAIEVKCSAYIQRWKQNRLSNVVYDIAKKMQWVETYAGTQEYVGEQIRAADCYVFCLYNEKDFNKVNILDLSAWEFYVLPTAEIEKKFKNQKTVALSVLQKCCEAVSYSELKDHIDSVLGFGQ